MRIGIIGHLGVIGSAMKRHLEYLGHEVVGYDIADRSTRMIDVLDTASVFVCVPTPSKERGECDTSIVENTVQSLIFHLDYRGYIFIRSTVEPGTTDRLSDSTGSTKLFFVPEFIREHSADEDMRSVKKMIIGVPFTRMRRHGIIQLINIFSNDIRVFDVYAKEAEYMKYFHNALNATKVTFANAFYEMMTKNDSDYTRMLESYDKLGLNDTNYLKVNESMRGFGGPCLPKDTKAISRHAYRVFSHPMNYLLNEVLDINSNFPTTIPDNMREE